MVRARLSDAQVSIRLVWPYMRLASRYPGGLAAVSRAGLSPADYANPDTRLPHRLAIELLNASLLSTGDPLLGLRAAELSEPGDFDALEYAARSCSTLREAILCIARYTQLMNDAAEITLLEQGARAVLSYRVTDGVPQPAAANDFAVSVLAKHAWQATARPLPIEEIRFTHSAVPYLDEYRRLFATRITFNAKANAIVTRREWLDTALVRANPRVAAAFEKQIQRMLKRLQVGATTSDRVRNLVVTQLSQGDVSMDGVARRLGMSVATLRRRLAFEGMTFTELLDELRHELARRYLAEGQHALSEVAFLLGFSDVVAFYKAFRRWSGSTPMEFRKRVRDAELS